MNHEIHRTFIVFSNMWLHWDTIYMIRKRIFPWVKALQSVRAWFFSCYVGMVNTCEICTNRWKGSWRVYVFTMKSRIYFCYSLSWSKCCTSIFHIQLFFLILIVGSESYTYLHLTYIEGSATTCAIRSWDLYTWKFMVIAKTTCMRKVSRNSLCYIKTG